MFNPKSSSEAVQKLQPKFLNISEYESAPDPLTFIWAGDVCAQASCSPLPRTSTLYHNLSQKSDGA